MVTRGFKGKTCLLIIMSVFVLFFGYSGTAAATVKLDGNNYKLTDNGINVYLKFGVLPNGWEADTKIARVYNGSGMLSNGLLVTAQPITEGYILTEFEYRMTAELKAGTPESYVAQLKLNSDSGKFEVTKITVAGRNALLLHLADDKTDNIYGDTPLLIGGCADCLWYLIYINENYCLRVSASFEIDSQYHDTKLLENLEELTIDDLLRQSERINKTKLNEINQILNGMSISLDGTEGNTTGQNKLTDSQKGDNSGTKGSSSGTNGLNILETLKDLINAKVPGFDLGLLPGPDNLGQAATGVVIPGLISILLGLAGAGSSGGSPPLGGTAGGGAPPEGSSPDGFPLPGEKRVLVGKTDGRTIEIEYDRTTGEWKNTETGYIVNPDKFDKAQDDLADSLRLSAADLEDMSKRQDANSKAIDQHLNDWRKLEQIEKTADKYNVGEKGGPGDVDKAIQSLKDDMLEGKAVDQDKIARINKVIDSRIKGDSAADNDSRWEEKPWYKDADSAFKANAEVIREVVTGQDEEGNTSLLGLGARAAIGAATGGASEYILTVAEALSRVKEGIDNNESGFRATTRAIGMVVLDESVSRCFEAGSKLGFDEIARRYPTLTNKVADAIENGALKVNKIDQAASARLGFISKESAEGTIEQINKHLADKAADAASEGTEQVIHGAVKNVSGAGEDVADGVRKKAAGGGDGPNGPNGPNSTNVPDGPDEPDEWFTRGGGDGEGGRNKAAGKDSGGDGPKSPSGAEEPITRGGKSAEDVLDDPAVVAKAEKTMKETIKDFDKLAPSKQQELIREQANYNEYRLQAEENTWNLADKVQKFEPDPAQNLEPLSVKDVIKMKADPASMRTLKDIEKVDGLGRELGIGGARKVQTEFNNVLNKKVYEPSNKDVRDFLSKKYDGAEIRVKTVRTPGTKENPWDVNTDNDIVAQRKKIGPDGAEEWVEIPHEKWEDVYFKSYAKNTGFNPEAAAKEFPDVKWSEMSDVEQFRKWGELHGETPSDVYHIEGARDFSKERTSILSGQSPKDLFDENHKLQRTLLDSEALGLMEKNKINDYWERGSMCNQTEAMEQLRKAGDLTQALEKGYKGMGYQTEAMEQLRKAGDLTQALEKGYKDMGYKISDMPDNMKEAIAVVNDRSLSPATRAARLQELKYDTPGDLIDKLTSRIHALRIARK